MSKCFYDPKDPTGPCISCKKITNPTIHNIPCLRYKLVEFAVYRPWATGYTARWPKLETMRNVAQWSSPEIRKFTICASVFPKYKITVRHRPFTPIEGDKMERKWMDGKQKKSISIPPWAIVDMEEAAQDFRKVVDETAFDRIDEYLELKHADELVRTTYDLAKQHLIQAKVSVLC